MNRKAVAYLSAADELAPEDIPGDLEVVHTVRDPDPDRARLGEALGWISSGQAEVLLVARLGAVAVSLRELSRLLGWLAECPGALVAVDVRLDTGQRTGRVVHDVLREVERWGREPDYPRRPPGRPGLQSSSPELARRIAELREQGLSLKGIADALNAEGVPTPRGGARWRPSSVQSALGYRRPAPPGPGHPPPPPPGGRPGPKQHQRPHPGRGPRPGGRP